MSEFLDLTGKVALITGAGQNVGREIALRMAAHGAEGIIVNDYVLDRAQSVANEIISNGGKAVAIAADVSKHDSVKEMFAQANSAFGRVDILVNNAGNAGANPTEKSRAPFWETSPADWESVIGVNLYGVINCTSAAVQGMMGRKSGRIVTIISDAGRTGEGGSEIYAGAKAGAAGFMRGVARAMGRYQVTANCVSIAAMGTPAIMERLATDPERAKKVLERYVIRRVGQPSDVASMVLFLASDASGWVTGQTYPVNGGYSFSL